MTRIRFDGPQGGHRLVVGGITIERGDTAEVPDDEARRLEAASWVDITVMPEPRQKPRQHKAARWAPPKPAEPEAAGMGRDTKEGKA